MKNIFSIMALAGAVLFSAACNQPAEDKTPELKEPALNITTEGSQVSMNSDGGNALFKYEIVNPQGLDSVTIEIADNPDWISVGKHETFATSGRVTLDVAKNYANKPREATIMISYIWSEEAEPLTKQAIIYQYEGNFYIEDLNAGLCRYWGVDEAGLYHYEVILGTSDHNGNTPNSAYYAINFCDSIETEDLLPEAGKYIYADEINYRTGKCLFGYYMSYYSLDANGEIDYSSRVDSFNDFTIEREGDIFTIQGELTDMEGQRHRVYYQGTLDTKHYYDFMTDLKEDKFMDLTDMHIEAFFSPLYFWVNLWTVYLVPDNAQEGDPMFVIELYVDVEGGDNFAKGIPTSEYSRDYIGMCDPYLFCAGHLYNRQYIRGSWFYSCTDVLPNGNYEQGRPRASIEYGSISFENDGNGETVGVSFELFDVYDHRIYGERKDIPITYYNYTEEEEEL